MCTRSCSGATLRGLMPLVKVFHSIAGLSENLSPVLTSRCSNRVLQPVQLS